jgi:hypothetical protein
MTEIYHCKYRPHEPHPKQAEFLNSLAKRKMVKAGRRGGKTEGLGIEGREIIEKWRFIFCLGEWRGGTSPLRSLRTGLEPLGSSGSHYPAVGLTPNFQCGNKSGCLLATPPNQ